MRCAERSERDRLISAGNKTALTYPGTPAEGRARGFDLIASRMCRTVSICVVDLHAPIGTSVTRGDVSLVSGGHAHHLALLSARMCPRRAGRLARLDLDGPALGAHHHPGGSSGRSRGWSVPYKGATMAKPDQGSLSLLDDPAARRLLASQQVAHLAYNWTDGTPRCSPIWFHWNGNEVVMVSPPTRPEGHRPAER